MNLEDILRDVETIRVHGPQHVAVKGIAYDSRQVRDGFMFVALPGLHVDGTIFIEDAAERGASVVVAEQPPLGRGKMTHVQVEDARRALAEVSRAFYHNPSKHLELVGITGTNGKTTTSYMVRAVLKAAGRRPGLIGTVAYEAGDRIVPATRTTPESHDLHRMLAEMVNAGCLSAVMEVSSHALVQKRVWGLDFNVAVFTNLTQDHLDYHGSMENYFAAKKLMFSSLGVQDRKAYSVINIDDPWGVKLAGTTGRYSEDITFGENPEAQVRALDVKIGEHGSQFRCYTPWGEALMKLKLLGSFNVSNALAAVAACGAIGIDLERIVDVLRSFESVPGRLEKIANRLGFNVFVDYAHTHNALESVLRTVREVSDGRLIVVFGCGGNRDQEKRALMGEVVSRYADIALLTSDNPRKEDPMDIIRHIEKGMSADTNYQVEESREKAIFRAIKLARRGDLVLIAGKGHENYQEFAHTIIPFDDREVARRAVSDRVDREKREAGGRN